jgi:hypothetical protein
MPSAVISARHFHDTSPERCRHDHRDERKEVASKATNRSLSVLFPSVLLHGVNPADVWLGHHSPALNTGLLLLPPQSGVA